MRMKEGNRTGKGGVKGLVKKGEDWGRKRVFEKEVFEQRIEK